MSEQSYGGYIPPIGAYLPLQLFLKRVRQLVPEVLKDLRDTVMPEWRMCREDGRALKFATLAKLDPEWRPWVEETRKSATLAKLVPESILTFDYDDPRFALAKRVVEVIWEWAERNHLVRPFSDLIVDAQSQESSYCSGLYDIIIKTLTEWDCDPAKVQALEWSVACLPGCVLTLPAPEFIKHTPLTGDSIHVSYYVEFTFRPWNVFGGESRAAAKKRMLDEVEAQLDKILGYEERTIQGCERMNPKLDQDFELLVRFKLLGESADRIARTLSHGPTRQSVEAAYHRAAEALMGAASKKWLNSNRPKRK